MRKIIHIDMDAFYASIEQRDNPKYKGKPLAVGYAGNRGVVAAASYEARKYGVRSAMSSKMALRKCPDLIFVPTRFEVYHQVSEQIHSIFHQYTELVEPLSLDEAYLDVTENFFDIPYASEVAFQIREKIYNTTGLTASAGISYNKFLAKIASDYNKPNGQFIVKPASAEKFVEGLEIERFFGIGKVTANKMHALGIKNGFDLKQKSREELISYFGKAGSIYYLNARAIDDRLVIAERMRKSVGAETTFSSDITDLDELIRELRPIVIELLERITASEFKGRTVTLKVKYADFRIITRSKTLLEFADSYSTLLDNGIELLKLIDTKPKIRLLGLSVKNAQSDLDEKWIDAIQLRLNFNGEVEDY